MKKIILLFAAFLALTGCKGTYDDASLPYTIKDGKIVFASPQREAGQESMLAFRTDPIDTVRIGFVGLGSRGSSAVKRFTRIEGIKIVALCDKVEEKVQRMDSLIVGRGFPEAVQYSGDEGYKALCEREDIDLVYICTSWQMHVPVAVYAMEHGKHVAIEVPAATSLKDCWTLVNTSEKTRRHCMMLENCCYDFFELTTLNMAQQGLFGEVIHGEGAYIHNLNEFWDYYQDNWRLEFNQNHRGDVYPTHGFGPVCQVMNIHRGDKMDYLVAMDTKSVCGTALVKEKMQLDTCMNSDYTITLIRTHNQKTMEIHHNVMTVRPYDRKYQISGTEGFANKYFSEGFSFSPDYILSKVPQMIPFTVAPFAAHTLLSKENNDILLEHFKHPIHREIEEVAKRVGGHGGMDYVMDYRLIHCLRGGLPLDMDVYDMAEWCCVSELGAVSMNHGSMPVEVPDFTRGDWNKIQGLQLAD